MCKKIDELISKGKTVKKNIKTIEAGTTAPQQEGGGKNVEQRWPRGRPFRSRSKFSPEVRVMEGEKSQRRSTRRNKGERGGEVVMKEVIRGEEEEAKTQEEAKEVSEEHETEITGNNSDSGFHGRGGLRNSATRRSAHGNGGGNLETHGTNKKRTTRR